MLESRPFVRSLHELGSSCMIKTRTRPVRCSRHHQFRQLSSSRCNLQQEQAASQPQPQSAPPSSEPVPKVADLARYAAKVSSHGGFLKSTTQTYAAYGSSEKLWAICRAQADYAVPSRLKNPPEPALKNKDGEDIGEGTGVWFASRANGGIELPVTFTTWSQIMFLHLYLLLVRLRRLEPDQVKLFQQHLLDFFFQDAEDKMEKWHGMAAKGVRNKNLKELWESYRGVLLSYDEGLIKNDAVLASAVWRSIFRGSVDANVTDIALVTAYLRKELHRLDTVSEQEFTNGLIEFGTLRDVAFDISERSPLMSSPFDSKDQSLLD